MSNSNGIISAPISLTDDVPIVIGVGSFDLGTLCISDKVNQWSMVKPSRYNKMEEITDAERASINYGFDIASASSLTLLDLFNKASSNKSWIYLKPRGGDNEPYRLTDFDKYNHKAAIPFDYSEIPNRIPTINDSFAYVFKFKVNAASEIDINKFAWFKQYASVPNNKYYYSIAYRRSGDTNILFARGPEIADMTGHDITIQVPLSLGTYDFLFMISTLNDPTPIYSNSTIVPNGLFKVEIYKQTNYGVITIVSGFTNLRMDNYGISGLTTVKISIKSETDNVVPATYGRLDLLIYIYNTSNQQVDSFYIQGTSDASFGYEGVTAEISNLNYGSEIRFSDYGITGSDVHKCEIIPTIIKTSGQGQFKFADSYSYPVNR